jgi:hypothetical protein
MGIADVLGKGWNSIVYQFGILPVTMTTSAFFDFRNNPSIARFSFQPSRTLSLETSRRSSSLFEFADAESHAGNYVALMLSV